MSSVYYSPEKFGLHTMGEIHWPGSNPWGFDLTVVWHDDYGNLYMAEDSGCSYPTPFDGYEIAPEVDPVDDGFRNLVHRMTQDAIWRHMADRNKRQGSKRDVELAVLLTRIQEYTDALRAEDRGDDR